jgi:hypothetical protein
LSLNLLAQGASIWHGLGLSRMAKQQHRRQPKHRQKWFFHAYPIIH